MSIYLNDWKGATLKTIRHAFLIDEEVTHDINILLASYSSDVESGYAFILFEHEGNLYEVHASHDSIEDLAGQWEPEETSVESLRFRMQRGNLGTAEAGINIFRNELEQVLHSLIKH